MNDLRFRQRLPGRGRIPALWLGLALLLLLLLAFPAGAQESTTGTNQVLVLQADGPVTPTMASYFNRGINAGQAQQANAILIILDTPGGGIDTTQEIVQSFRNAQVPIIVYIAPAGAQAASAGSIITLAAHAAGMAPETVIGAASPVDGSGADIEETLYRKLVEDLKAQVRGLVSHRGAAPVALAEAMIEDARAVSAEEALAVGLIDAVAVSSPDLLNQLDGLEVTVAGQPRTLHTANAQQQPLNMSWVEVVLHALANPLLISLLLTIGVQAILIELSSPGGYVAGLIGVLSLGLAFYGLGQLPTNWFGLGLIFVAFVLFIFEVKSPGLGGLAVAGTLTLLAGLLVLFNSPGTPSFARISLLGAIIVAAMSGGLFLFVVAKVTSAQRRRPITGREGMMGQPGRARKAFVLAGEGPLVYSGNVLVMGEIWQAQATEPIAQGDEISVTGIDGMVLFVEKASTQPQPQETHAI